MDFISGFTTISSFLIACILAIGLQLFFFSPISPDILEFPAISSSLVPSPSNSILQDAEKLGEGLLVKPEDVTIDEMGVLYTATRDGWIKRLHKNGSWENWQWINSDQLLGITTAAAGGIIVCDCEKGLLWFTEDGVTNLASHVNGVKIRFADDVIEASDGSVYFSVASTKFGFHDWYLDLLEAKPHGQLLRYDPALNETSVLLGDLYFANGVALSPNQDYLIVCETWKFRCLKYWLAEEKRGVKEVFIDNLPGGPDNINLAPDGTFWIALLELVPSRLQYLHGSKLLKKLLATLPSSMIQVHGVHEKAMVANVGSDGKIIKILDDPTGKIMSFVTSALEFEGHLYLGSLNSDFIGKLPL